MAEISYISPLNIPVKSKGSILHSYEYNATVDKINEIVESLHVSYEYHNAVPGFLQTNTPIVGELSGTGYIMHNASGKMYPVTESSYVIVGGATLTDKLTALNSKINTNLESVTTVINNLRDSNNERFNELSEAIDDAKTALEYNINTSYFKLDDRINEIDSKIGDSYSYISSKYDDLKAYVVSTVNVAYNELNSNISLSYNALDSAISYISDELYRITTELDEKYDTAYSYLNSLINDINTELNNKIEDARAELHNRITLSYNKLDNKFVAVNAQISYLSDQYDELSTGYASLSERIENIEMPTYGFGISIEDNKISVNTNEIVDNRTIYINSYGKLVVNNEEVLIGAESKFKFIDSYGNWVGDMNNVKNYIDDGDNAVKSYIYDKITDLSEDINMKFTQFELIGDKHGLSYEFIEQAK